MTNLVPNEQPFWPNCCFQQILLITGEQAFVDTPDWFNLKAYSWHLVVGKYAGTGHTSVRMHHMILGVTDCEQLEVHHVNNNGLDNRRENLRLLSFSDHLITRSKQLNNKSQYKGVSWKAPQGNRRGRWVAQISKDKRKIHLGYFETPEEAAIAYDKAAKSLFGDVAFLNFPAL